MNWRYGLIAAQASSRRSSSVAISRIALSFASNSRPSLISEKIETNCSPKSRRASIDLMNDLVALWCNCSSRSAWSWARMRSRVSAMSAAPFSGREISIPSSVSRRPHLCFRRSASTWTAATYVCRHGRSHFARLFRARRLHTSIATFLSLTLSNIGSAATSRAKSARSVGPLLPLGKLGSNGIHRFSLISVPATR